MHVRSNPRCDPGELRHPRSSVEPVPHRADHLCMKRSPFLVAALVAVLVQAGPGAARQSDLPSGRLTVDALAPQLASALDSRLAQIALSVKQSGPDAALATARSNGFRVAQGKLRVVVRARAGHVAGARAAVGLAHGNVVTTSGLLLEALVPPKSLRQLAASSHVAHVLPVPSGTPVTTTGLRVAPAQAPAASETSASGVVELGFDASVPDAPTDAAASGGDGQATITFTEPASDGGDAILYYTVTASPGGMTASSGVPSITVGGLTNGVAYTFTVSATNGVGTGPESSPSNAVTPAEPTRLEPEPPAESVRPGRPTYTAPAGARPDPRHGGGGIGEF